MKFKRGQSGNPSGRPKGSRNKTTIAVEKILDDDAEVLTRKAIELAKAGDLTALRLCMERIVPPRKDRPVFFDMSKLECAADALKASIAIVQAVSAGELTPAEAGEISRVLNSFTRVAETADLAARIERLENALREDHG